MTGAAALEWRIDRDAAEAVGGDEHRVPASGPAERRRRALHVGPPLGRRRIVGGGDGALLRAERLRARRGATASMSSGSTPPAAGIGLRSAVNTPIRVLTMWAIASAPTLPAVPLPTR